MPDLEHPLVSIVTVCLNAEAHVREAMESVLGQGYPSIEYVVVDGGSSDGTLDIIREFEVRFEGRMRWISEPDEGLYDAMNKGIAMATGDLIGILNADDSQEPGAVERVVETWRGGPRDDIVYGDLKTVDASGEEKVLTAPDRVDLDALREGMVVFHPSTFVPASVYRELGLYDTSFRIAADYDFILRCAEAGCAFRRVDAVLVRFSLQGLSHRYVREADRETTLVRIAHGVPGWIAWARFYKRAAASSVHGVLVRSEAGRDAYERYKS